MLDSFRRGQRWLTLLLVTFIGAVFVFFMGVGSNFGPGNPTGNAVVELGDIRMQIADFQRLRQRQDELYQEQLGEQYDAKAMTSFIDAQTLRQLVDSAVLARSATDLGMQVSREEIQDLVRQSPGFRDESGRFNQEQFVDYVTYEFGSQRNFLEVMRHDLLRQKMVGLIFDQASVSPSEARDAALYGLEQIRIAYVALDTTQLPADVAIDDASVVAYLEANRPELEGIYRERTESYTVPERAKARHILIQVGPDDDETRVSAARAKADAARQRVVSGEAFEVVAAEVSEDPGSKTQGGDIGEFSRGTHATPLEDATFSLKPGDLSEVIRTDYGFHVIRLDSLEPARTRPFEGEADIEIARAEVTRRRAEERAQQISIQLADAIGAGTSLESAARELGLSVQRTPLLNRRPDGFIPGLGAAEEVMATAFGLELERPSSPKIHTVDDRLVLVELLERSMPDSQELDATVAELEKNLLDAKRNRMVQDWIDRRREELEASGELLVNSSLVISNS
jgi:peptidyl-prolyl cis-trans isomerase D